MGNLVRNRFARSRNQPAESAVGRNQIALQANSSVSAAPAFIDEEHVAPTMPAAAWTNVSHWRSPTLARTRNPQGNRAPVVRVCPGMSRYAECPPPRPMPLDTVG